MACTDIQNLSSLFFLFIFKGIFSSLEGVCCRMVGKKLILSMMNFSPVFSSVNFNPTCYIIYSQINIHKCQMVLEKQDYWRSLTSLQAVLSTLQKHWITLPMQEVLPRFLHGKQHLLTGLQSLQTIKCLLQYLQQHDLLNCYAIWRTCGMYVVSLRCELSCFALTTWEDFVVIYGLYI